MRFLSILALVLMSPSALAQPSASVAVAFDLRASEVRIAEGLADRATARAVTADDPVRIASISKLVVALGVMRLVERGTLDLDRDVSDYLGWSMRHPGFPDTAITLRLLLSHRAGLLDGDDDYIVPVGERLRDRLEPPRLWDPAHAPGSDWFHYANMNFPVVASVMEAATDERFDRLMAREVFEPLGLKACFNWSGCDPATLARAVVLYRASGEVARDDLNGVVPACPGVPAADGSCDMAGYVPGTNGAIFSPQGGLRISMTDLAKIGQMLLAGGRGFLSPAAFAQLTRPHWRSDRDNGLGEDGRAGGVFRAYGLAVHTIGTARNEAMPGDDLFGDGLERIGHSGEAYGLRSGLWVDPVGGTGLAFFTTAVPDDEPRGTSAFTQREERIVRRAREPRATESPPPR